jgi:hypothetical protein
MGGGNMIITFSKKQIIILMIAIIIYTLILVGIVQILDKTRSPSDFVPVKGLSYLEIFAIILSLYTTVDIWRFPERVQRRVNARPPQIVTARRRFKPGTAILMMIGAFLLAPALYGLVVFFMGMPATGFYYFAGLSVVAGSAWGIYTLRKSEK